MSIIPGWNGDIVPTEHEPGPCFCVGPQNGQPLCPCKMRRYGAEEGRVLRLILDKYDLVPKKPKT